MSLGLGGFFLLLFFFSPRDERAKKKKKGQKKKNRHWGRKWKMILSREARGGEKAPVSLLDALGVQLCGVNSHKTSLCSQKMRAGRV